MTTLAGTLQRLIADLDQLGAAFALIGGLAVSARAEPRFTRDIDIAVSVAGDPAAEALVHALQGRGYRLVASIEQDAAGRLATVRLAPPGGDADGVVVDLLFASSVIEPELVATAEPLDVLPGLRVPVARAGHLVALKALALDDRTRPQDRADALALLRTAGGDDVALARQSVTLITRRGFARGKDLVAELESLIAAAC